MEPFFKMRLRSWSLHYHDKRILVFYVIVAFTLVYNVGQTSSDGSLPVDYLPQIEILEIVSSPLNRSTSVNLWKDRNTDIIIGEDTSATSRILMKCNATYPVQWVYLGDGKPEFTTFTNVKWHDDPNVQMSFEAEASLGLLGFQGILREEDTGNYTCRSIQEPSVHSYYYIYVPGDGLFSAPNGTNITYTPQDQFVRIPCGVSHPKTSVSLCKRDKNGKMTCSVSGASGFNAKGGFLLNLKKQRDPTGTYVCTADFRRAIRIVEHHLMKEGDKPKPKPPSPLNPPPTKNPKPGKNLCDPSPCGKQAECSVVDGRAVCYCFRGLNGNPYDECAPGKCRSSRDCPRGKFCRQGQCTSDPCNPSPCGLGGECTLFRGQSKCSCQRGYSGLPPNCVKSCSENYDCSEDEACIKNICQSPCPGPCGQNAECRVLTNGSKRTAQCSCPTGLIGDPLKSCFKFNSTTPGPWNNCPPGYVGHPPACNRKECEMDSDCLYGRKCVKNMCDKGFNPACKDKCGHFAECQIIPGTTDPVCVCPPGTTGNPLVVCSSQGSVQPQATPSWGDPCRPNPCRAPAECRVEQGSRICACPVGYYGNPSNCVTTTAAAFPYIPEPSPSRGGSVPPTFPYIPERPPSRGGSIPSAFPSVPEPSPSRGGSVPPTFPYIPERPPSRGGSIPSTPCRYDEDCRPSENCLEGRCQDLCNGFCGFNAICEPGYQRKYRSILSSGKLVRSQQSENSCSCPQGHEGNPYVSCMPIREGPPPPSVFPSASSSTSPICKPSSCGRFAECTPVNNEPLCRCQPGYDGNPYQECRYSVLSPSPPDPINEDVFSRPTPGRGPPSELDFEGHSWGHHTDLNLNNRGRDPFPQSPPRSGNRDSSEHSTGGSRFNFRPPYRDKPYPPPSPPYYDENTKSPHAPQSSHYPPEPQSSRYPPQPTNQIFEENPTPKTLGRPMPPLDSMPPPSSSYDPRPPPSPPYDSRPPPSSSYDSRPPPSSSYDSPPPPSSSYDSRPPPNPPYDSRPPPGSSYDSRLPPSPPYDSRPPPSSSYDSRPPPSPPYDSRPPPSPPYDSQPLPPFDSSLPQSPSQSDQDRDECTFRNPYADYDMDSCGVGLRCERDFRGIKRCICISPFDCTGPTSIYHRGKCQTNRDCLLSDHTCINGTCRNPCSPEYSPCAGIAYAECRVIEGNVLCTCRRGYVGNPASGLDCRPKRATLSAAHPSSVAINDNNNNHDRDFVLVHFMNGSDHVINVKEKGAHSHYNTSNIWNNGTENSGGDSNAINQDEDYADDDDGDIIMSSGSTGSAGSTTRQHRRHDTTNTKIDSDKKEQENDILYGHCGFGTGHNCDEKSHCRVIGGRPMCVCKTGYRGEFPHCKSECEKPEDCLENMACQYHQCMDPCIEEKTHCAQNAFCRVSNHTAGCECEAGYVGIPWIQCSKAGDSKVKDDCMGFNCEKRNSKI